MKQNNAVSEKNYKFPLRVESEGPATRHKSKAGVRTSWEERDRSTEWATGGYRDAQGHSIKIVLYTIQMD